MTRWTIHRAAKEFGIHRETLAKRLEAAAVTPSKAYSTRDICRAVYGDYEREKLRRVKEQADKLASQNELARQSLVRTEEVYLRLAKVFGAMRQRILSSTLTEDEQGDLLNDLGGLLEKNLVQ